MITLDKKMDKKVFLPCLSCVSVGRGYDLLRADIQEHLTLAQKEIGFKYCRFHAVFHDDMDVVYKKPDGTFGYHWHHVDKIYDFLLSIGMKPFVELNPMPTFFASGEQTMFWYKMNITPPTKMELWYDLIRSFTLHVTERYGYDEVSTWFFEVWNEPNLKCFWTGSQQDYFDLYEASAKAVKSVSEDYRVGGPATAVCAWVGDLIEYCTDKNIPLDFVSTHLYPQDEYCLYKTRENSPYQEIGDYFVQEVRKVKETVEKSSRPDIDIYWTEFNTLTADGDGNITFLNNPALDLLYGGSCVARCMIETMDYSKGVSYWTVSDIFEESQMRHTPFSGTYGLLTINGTKKATYNVFTMFKKMRGDRFETNVSAPKGCGMLACEDFGTTRVMLYNCNFPEIKDQPTWTDTIVINGANPDEYICEQAKIKAGQGSPYEEWIKMGRPANLTPFEEEYLKGCAAMEYKLLPISENGEVEFSLAPDEVCYIEVHKKPSEVALKTANEILESQLNTSNKR